METAWKITIRGAAFYEDEYEKSGGRWRIRRTGYRRTYEEILSFYYPGTELAKAPVTKVRVLLAEGVKTVRVTSDIPFRLQGARGAPIEVAAGTIAFGPAL